MKYVARRGLQVIVVLAFFTFMAYVGLSYEANNTKISRTETETVLLEVIENNEVENEVLVQAIEADEDISVIETKREVLNSDVEVLAANINNPYLITTAYDEKIVVENGLEIHYIAGDTFRGVMTVVADASRVFVGTPRDYYDGNPGASATYIAKRYDALYAVNGAFFVDTNYAGNGGTPIGFVFSKGVQKAGGSGTAFTLMGLDNNNNFILDTMTGAQATAIGIRDAVTCKPVLIKNGAITDLSGASKTLIDARTCIGATAEGYILFLTIDGRMSHSFGATTTDCANVMLAFGAVNAGNLDGGGSVSIYYGGETPLDAALSSRFGSRASPEAFCISR